METLKERLRSFRHSRIGVAAIVSLLSTAVVAAVKFLVPLAFDNWVSEHVLSPVTNGWGKFVALPTGATLSLLVVTTVVLLAIGLVAHPTVAAVRSWREDTKPRKLSSDERYELDRIREMWKGDSREACEVAGGAIDSMRRVLDRRNQRWAPLLDTVIIRLRQAASAMDGSLQSDESRADIEKRFEEVRIAYSQCVCWCNRCLLIDKSLVDEDNQSWFKKRDIQRWAVLHRSFASSVETLLKYSGFDHFCKHMEDDLGRIHFVEDDSAISRLLD